MAGFKYFALYGLEGDFQAVYRFPDNEKLLHEQIPADVEVYSANYKTWFGCQRQKLLDRADEGWFIEKDDQISEKRALKLIADLDKK